MNISNTKFDSAKSVGIISNTLNKIDSSDKTISTGINTIMLELVSMYINDEFKPINMAKFTADDVGKHSKKFCVEKLGITETDYKKNEIFSRAKKDSLREAFKIAELVFQGQLYNNNKSENILSVNKVGKATINGHAINSFIKDSDGKSIDTFNKGNDEYISLTKKDLLSASSKKYGIANPKSIGNYDKSFTAFRDELEKQYNDEKLTFSESVDFNKIQKNINTLNEMFDDIKKLYVAGLTPQQALKGKFIRTLSDFPKVASNQ